MASMSHLLAASNSLLWGLQARSLSYAAWAQKEPFQLLGDWEPEKVTLFKKTEVSLENRTCFTSKRRSVVNWYDSSTVSIWLIYLSWWASSAEQYWKFRATADPHHVLPVASLCFWIHPPRTLQHEDWNGCLPARKKTQEWQGIWSVCLWEHQETPSTKNTSVHTCKHTWAHMFFFNKGGSHSKKKRIIYAHLDLQVCSPCSSLMRLEDAMIWYYMTIYDYIYATIWYYFVTYLESWIILPMTLLWIRQCKAKRRISLGTFFTHFRRRLDSCWFCMGNWTYHSAFGYP